MVDVLLPNALCGMALIGCGLLVKRFPVFIAGNNTMSTEKKEACRYRRIDFLYAATPPDLGALWIGLAVVFYLTDPMNTLPILSIIYLPGYLIWIAIRSQRFDHNK